MADEQNAPQEVRIVQDIPVVFADGVMSQSYIEGVSKFYLYRTDAAPIVTDGARNVPVVQVVMSAHGFAGMIHFFEHRLKMMIADGAISQASVDKIKETIYEDPRKETVYPADTK
jgi:hypothetical protein